MTTELGKKTINSWEWLDAFCLTQRENCALACGQHGIIVVQIDDFIKMKNEHSEEYMADLLSKVNALMEEYDMEDTLVARYNDYTFAVILHYLASREEIAEVCEEIISNFHDASKRWGKPITVSIGAAECHHDVNQGYKCATQLALEALAVAKSSEEKVFLAPDTLPMHPLALEALQGTF